MPVTFKSKATGDLVMLQAHAEQVLALLDKSAAQPGILQVRDMPAALAILRALPDIAPADAAQLDAVHDQGLASEDELDQPDVPMSDGITLRRRAWPLVRMIEQAMAAEHDIVWGV